MSRKESIALIVILVISAYIAVADLVFSFRHPWATQTERLIYLPQALTFQRVDYSEMRPRPDHRPAFATPEEARAWAEADEDVRLDQ